jgi:AcrR family transcriptional regulator
MDRIPSSAPPVDQASAAPRRGRRPKSRDGTTPDLSRDAVIECATNLARREALSEISMSRLARELGVTPALIHYYVGSRDELLSAVMNLGFRERLESLPPLTGDWRKDLKAVARATQQMHVRWPGLVTYIATHNRFRLFQKVQPGEVDYGLAFFDHVGRILRGGGFSPSQAALAYHLLMTFLVSVGAARANSQTPSEHGEFITSYVAKFDSAEVPGAAFLAKPFSKIDAAATFNSGLKVLLDAFESWLASKAQKRAEKSRV